MAASTDDGSSMSINQAGIDLIKRFEGFRPTPYRDPVGILTVGYGHVVRPGEKLKCPLTEDAASAMLLQDISLREAWMKGTIRVPVTANQYAALVSLVFNAGTAPIAGTLWHELNRGNYAAAAEQFLRWDHAGGKVLAGLTARRQAERALFLTPDSPTA